ncbi:MSMEG_0570 family nitrogen starvation response protein [Nakamurella deserti]|uniref:MSMEG_0570 family nitrogen starvation response protein n=1 Tax=Nakamurella deserti TaxID=2164074 RepID=UPI000DBE788C|nr:MSMEG_0570 family nitrogen starvation response protein [Nakamurella deserti]
MPEMNVQVRWPDGRLQDCYSPSLVMHDHLTAGTDYAVADFVARSRAALHEASERVRSRYGFACTSAMATLDDIERRAAHFADASAMVTVVAMKPALPAVTR